MATIFGIIVLIIGLIVIAAVQSHKAKLARLREKYKDEEIVQKIMNGEFWYDQTADQLVDSLGTPESIDRKIMKTKTREVWKYQHRGANRYGLRITLENGFVSGWDQKS